ncbi:uncharacterized protein A4U43_C08F35620 [Asparagus officinalis]|nr:uncharacterized protein A4U43_C08F35620 [Asparagus officinalis]
MPLRLRSTRHIDTSTAISSFKIDDLQLNKEKHEIELMTTKKMMVGLFILIRAKNSEMHLFCFEFKTYAESFQDHQLLLNASRTSLQRTRKTLRMAEATEQPFRPREKLKQYQQIFQNTHKHTYLKGRFDKITSVAIPLALAGSALFLIGRGVYNMSHGIGKKE